MRVELKPCPHCDKTKTLEIVSCQKVEGCEHFETCDIDPYVCVVCSVLEGGCGASGGYAPTEAEACEKWNTRTERTCVVVGRDELDGGVWRDRYSCGHSGEWIDGPNAHCPVCGVKVAG